MFYSVEILSSKGKLARVWLAAHHANKLTKPQILNTNIPVAIDHIIGKEQMPMALRLLGHLLLGIAEIYKRKADHMLKDSNDAIVSIKLAFRPTKTNNKGGGEKKKKKTNTATKGAITMRDPTGTDEITFDLSVPMEDFGDITLNLDDNDMMLLHAGDQPSDLFQASYSDITTQMPLMDPTPGPVEGTMDHIDDFDPTLLPDGANITIPSMELQPSIEIPLGDGGDIDMMDLNTNEPMPMDNSFHIEPEPPVAPNMMEIDPQADRADAEEALARRIGGKEVRVTSDRRTTTISAEEMRNYINDTDMLQREISCVPTTKSQLEHLAFEYADSDDNYHQFSIMAPAGIAPEISDMFRDATNLFADLPQIEGQEDDIMPPSAEAFELPQDIDYLNNDDIGMQPFDAPPPMEEPLADHSLSPIRPDAPEVGRRASSLGGPDFMDDPNDDSRFSVGPDMHSPADVSKQPEEFVPHHSYSKRTSVMHKFLEKSFQNQEQLVYQELVRDKKRSTVAQTFFECLVLKSRNVIDLEQNEPYGDIVISKTDSFSMLTV